MRYALPAPWFLLELTFVDACILVFDYFLGTLARLRLNAGLYLMPSYALPWCSYAMQREKVGKESRFTTRLHGLLRKFNKCVLHPSSAAPGKPAGWFSVLEGM